MAAESGDLQFALGREILAECRLTYGLWRVSAYAAETACGDQTGWRWSESTANRSQGISPPPNSLIPGNIQRKTNLLAAF